MKKRWFALFLCAVLLFGAVAGCAARSESPVASSAPAAPAMPAPAEKPAADSGYTGASQESDKSGWSNGSGSASAGGATSDNATAPEYGGHKIIKTASMGLETREFDSDLAYIKQKVTDMGGYVATSYISGRKPESYSDPGRYASLSLRIPQERMDTFLADARGIATVTYENSGGEDITASYFDTQSRLEIYTIQRDHIKALLENPNTPLEDRILVEQELFRLTYEIENLTTQLKRWDDLISYATISIELNEIPPAVAVASNDDFGTRINEGLRNTLSGLSVFFENLVVFLIVASPVLIIIAVVVIVIVVLARRRRRNKKMQAMPMQPMYGMQPPIPPQPPQAPQQPDQNENK